MVKSNLDPKILEKQIRDYNTLYRLGEPKVTDTEFDELVELLHNINPDANWFKKGIQDEVNDRKERLPIPMYSLEKVKTYDEILKWIDSCNLEYYDKLIITPKYDGISLCVNEIVGDAWTRGDGEYGQNCKDRFGKLINSEWRSYDKVTYSFGEAIFPTINFLKLKETTQYKSARNAVAGLMNSPVVSDNVGLIAYVRYGCNREDWDKEKQLDFLNENNKWIKTFYATVSVGSLMQNEDSFTTLMNNLFENLTSGFKCDGLVIDINDASKRNELGRLANNNPKYAIAYKNPDWSEREETVVKSVDWQISKDGRLAPVVNIEPIELCGATVSRCTAYNARYVRENLIDKGARVVIARSGDVIPKHLKTVKSSGDFNQILPSICPVCGKKVDWDNNNVDLICCNKECSGIMLARCVYFFSVLDFKEFREPTIKKLFNAGYKTPDSILLLSEEDLKKIEGIGNVAAKVLSRQFEELKKKGTNFAKLLTAYNKFGGVIAEKTCQKILDGLKLYTCKDVADFAKECDESWAADIEDKVEGVGFNTALAFVLGIEDWWVNDDDSAHIPITYYGLEEKSFEGQMTVVFTGFRNKDWENKLKEQGHKIGSSVSKKTTCLVVKERGSGSTKEQKAESLGVPIFTMQEFKEKFLS